MSEITQAAGRPPLAYSLPAFHPHDWREAPKYLDNLRALGFRHVVFHPTFPVSDDLRLGEPPDVREPFRVARSLGFLIRIEPHLDYAAGPYRWRREMMIDPTGDYLDRVLLPMAALAPEELTLGSELDLSANEFADRWEIARSKVPGVVGHKLNHDWLGGEPLIKYLSSLDYVALSWYVPDWRPLPEGYVIGELGLGSSDVSRPWHFDASTFRTPSALEVRRNWYVRRLQWLERQGSPRAACFWTAGHFDILGVMHPEWRDETVVAAVQEYNGVSYENRS